MSVLCFNNIYLPALVHCSCDLRRCISLWKMIWNPAPSIQQMLARDWRSADRGLSVFLLFFLSAFSIFSSPLYLVMPLSYWYFNYIAAHTALRGLTVPRTPTFVPSMSFNIWPLRCDNAGSCYHKKAERWRLESNTHWSKLSKHLFWWVTSQMDTQSVL